MGEYLAPDVFVEDQASVATIEQVGASCGGFLGVAKRGKVGVPTLVTSWNSFITNFADGLDSPFMQDSPLAYAVYGFFQNGGKRCYVQRVANGATKATATLTVGEVSTTFTAKDEGTWANTKLTFAVTANDSVDADFDLTIKYDGEIVEQHTNLTNTSTEKNYWVDVINTNSNFITATTGSLVVSTEDVAFSGGAEGSALIDTDYSGALTKFDSVDDLNLLAIPGQTSNTLMLALLTYCEGRKYVFPILDAPLNGDVTATKATAKALSNNKGALYYPWIKVADPLSLSGKLRAVPPSGHVMGVYARTIVERGVWKAPAGTEAIIKGAVELTSALSYGDIEVLNPAKVCCIISKPNFGIVVWGARSLSQNTDYKYVSDILLDMNIKKSVYDGTQVYVFEPNNPATWTRVITTVSTFLDALWREGGLFGATAKEAYYVKCDADLNTEAVRAQGKMITEVGYASSKPAEFVIFRFAHQITGND